MKSNPLPSSADPMLLLPPSRRGNNQCDSAGEIKIGLRLVRTHKDSHNTLSL